MSTPNDVKKIGKNCPECTAGKHINCTIEVLDDHDEWVVCGCLTNQHTHNK